MFNKSRLLLFFLPAMFQIGILQSSAGEREQKEASGGSSGAQLRCVCRATPGSSFAAEVARRVARRALERRTLSRAHGWKRSLERT